MLTNPPIAPGEYRHNYVRLAFVLGTFFLFIGYVAVHQVFERGNNAYTANKTLRAEDLVLNEVTPSDWVYRSLNALNQFWQLAWLLYSLTFIYRRSSTGYLYVSPQTFTLTFYVIFAIGFLSPPIWIIFFQKNYLIWTWIVYLISFLFLIFSLFILENNVSVNRKLYETEGFNRDIWCLRFFAQNGVGFFACWTAIRFVLALDTFLQVRFGLTIANAGTISLVVAGFLALLFFFGPNVNAVLVEKCAYQFSPWLVFIIYFWGVVENNWVPKHVKRNNIIAALELLFSVVAAILVLAFFTIRCRVSKIDPTP